MSFLKTIHFRIHQFFFAVGAKVSSEDLSFVKERLSEKEFELFRKLPVYEQKHAVHAAHLISKMAKELPNVDHGRVVKAALLHDIGKALIRISIFEKGIFTLLRSFTPNIYDFMAERGKKENAMSLFRKCYVYKYHDVLGANLLFEAGTENEIVELISKHSRPLTSNESLELNLLNEADNTL